MNKRRRADVPPAHAAGDGAALRPSLGLLAVAVGIVLGAVFWWWASPTAADEAAPAIVAAPPVTVPVAASAAAVPVAVAVAGHTSAPAARTATPPTATPRIPRTRDPDGDQTPDLSDYINEGERPTMNEVIERLHQAGVRTGLGAFSPPGTRPPLVGLAVPEDFTLPDGYVRHHQATDDGQRIEPVLMFAPDRQFVDAAGQPIAIPKNRVVPPELAPPGMPVRRIKIPAPADAAAPGR
jgi:hypothetical protein